MRPLTDYELLPESINHLLDDLVALLDNTDTRQLRKEILEYAMPKLKELYQSPTTNSRFLRSYCLAHLRHGQVHWLLHKRAEPVPRPQPRQHQTRHSQPQPLRLKSCRTR